MTRHAPLAAAAPFGPHRAPGAVPRAAARAPLTALPRIRP
jgi:hypothetical protein